MKTVQLKLVYLLFGAGILFGMGGVVGGGIATVFVVWLTSKKAETVVASQSTPTPKPSYTQDELRKAVMGKTEKQVAELLGEPKTKTTRGNDSGPRFTPALGEAGSTYDDVAIAVANRKTTIWVYEHIYHNNNPQKTGTKTTIYFQNGVVFSVVF